VDFQGRDIFLSSLDASDSSICEDASLSQAIGGLKEAESSMDCL
jgi:hypothetical protein